MPSTYKLWNITDSPDVQKFIDANRGDIKRTDVIYSNLVDVIHHDDWSGSELRELAELIL